MCLYKGKIKYNLIVFYIILDTIRFLYSIFYILVLDSCIFYIFLNCCFKKRIAYVYNIFINSVLNILIK